MGQQRGHRTLDAASGGGGLETVGESVGRASVRGRPGKAEAGREAGRPFSVAAFSRAQSPHAFSGVAASRRSAHARLHALRVPESKSGAREAEGPTCRMSGRVQAQAQASLTCPRREPESRGRARNSATVVKAKGEGRRGGGGAAGSRLYRLRGCIGCVRRRRTPPTPDARE